MGGQLEDSQRVAKLTFEGGADLLLLCDEPLSRRLKNFRGNSFMLDMRSDGGAVEEDAGRELVVVRNASQILARQPEETNSHVMRSAKHDELFIRAR